MIPATGEGGKGREEGEKGRRREESRGRERRRGGGEKRGRESTCERVCRVRCWRCTGERARCGYGASTAASRARRPCEAGAETRCNGAGEAEGWEQTCMQGGSAGVALWGSGRGRTSGKQGRWGGAISAPLRTSAGLVQDETVVVEQQSRTCRRGAGGDRKEGQADGGQRRAGASYVGKVKEKIKIGTGPGLSGGPWAAWRRHYESPAREEERGHRVKKLQ
eukprot:5355455-Prorocentrum_lima.AAC.1